MGYSARVTELTPIPQPGPASAEVSPTVRRILGETRSMLRESGWESVSMRRLAGRLGVKAPSLYKHISGKPELYGLLLEETKDRLAQALSDVMVVHGSDVPVGELLSAYRAAALTDPHVYLLLVRGRNVLSTEPVASEQQIIDAFTTAAGGDAARGLAMWAFAHGLVTAEITQEGADGHDPDLVWEAGAKAFGG